MIRVSKIIFLKLVQENIPGGFLVIDYFSIDLFIIPKLCGHLLFMH